MRFERTAIPGVTIIELEKHGDDRGFFARAWCAREFEEAGLNADLVQVNLSYNRERGTLRGLHYQAPPHAEAKLVRCVRGALYDVVVDLRPDSPSFLRWYGADLSAENRRALYVPEGCAHGFQTLADETEAFYQVSAFYAPESEGGYRWNDPAFAIDWPQPNPPAISDKDRAWTDFDEAEARRIWSLQPAGSSGGRP